MRRPAPVLAIRARAPRRLTGNALLWAAQAVLAALFLFGGASKLLMPAAALAAQASLPAPFLRLVGAVELLGALGLVLPGVLRLRAAWTPLAAGGLVLLMCGAVGATMAAPATAATPALALFPAAVGALAAAVACGRARPIFRAASAAPTAAFAPARPAARRSA